MMETMILVCYYYAKSKTMAVDSTGTGAWCFV